MLRVACVANSSIVYLLHAVHHPGHGNDAVLEAALAAHLTVNEHWIQV